jgi:hypothetical protein
MYCTIHQPQFIPWLGYFQKIAAADVFILLDDVQFKKNEYQNRNRIRTCNGWAWFTAPVEFHFGDLINETRLSSNPVWQKKLIKTLHTNYTKAPFFAQYAPAFETILTTSHATLSDLNTAVVKWLCSALQITTPIHRSSYFHDVRNDPTGRLIDLCKCVGADAYISGQDGPNYMDLALFEQGHIELYLQHFTHPTYPQLFCNADAKFEPYMSALDLLFNVGGEAGHDLITAAGTIDKFKGATY